MQDSVRSGAGSGSGEGGDAGPPGAPIPIVGQLEGLPAAAYVCDAEGRITYFNARAVEMWGRAPPLNDPRERFCGSVALLTANGEPLAHEHCGMALALRDGRPYLNCAITVVRPDGRRVPALAFAQPLYDADGGVQGAVNVLVDLSERLELERALNRAERDYADLFENGPMGIHWVDSEGIIIRANRAELQLLGYAHDEYVGRHIAEFHADRDAIEDVLSRLSAGETVQDREVRLRCKDGSIKHVALNSNVLWEDGRFVHTRCFTTDITARKAAEAALQEANARKDQFLAILAHELRNPLAPIVNAVAFLRREGPMDPKLEHARDIIDRQVVQLSRLVDDLLDVARITRGSLQIETEPLSARSIVESALEIAQPLIDAAGHRLRIDIDADPLYVDADGVRMAQVLSNLLSNAARYTAPNGNIAIRVAAVAATQDAAETVELSVADDGIGIAADELEHVFDMFVQARESSGHSGDGLGLGLTLARSIVEMHGGTLDARSAGPGHGSTFTVRLPRAAAPRERPPGEPAPPHSPAPRRILVVDDYVDSAVILGQLLAMEGHETRVAHDGHGALDAAQAFEPEVILLDIGLPDIDGFEVCRRARAQRWGEHALIVAISGWGQDDDKDRARAAGFDAHLTKPAAVEDVKRLLSA